MATQLTEPEVSERPRTTAPDRSRPRPFPINRALYEGMIAAGLLDHKSPVFLWKGRLVEKMTKGPNHNDAMAGIAAALFRVVPDGWHVRPGTSVAVSDHSVPEPDLSVARGTARDYLVKDVAAKDVSLVVEVSDSSLTFDAGQVLETFARAAIPVYWVVNVPGRTIDVYSRPSGPVKGGTSHYGVCQRFGPAEEVPVILDGTEVGRVRAGDVLP